ncbi:glutathione S-transferase [Cladochytrium replicatum]|nr:glutathione S-transferase [Cladochytrium replicatum]
MAATASLPVTFYNSIVCPFGQRAAIALAEAKVDFELVPIDLQDKPSWYHTVNPELKVPAVKIGDVAIAESLVIVELIADLYPESNLLPTDPIARAQVRWFIQYFTDKVNAAWFKLLGGVNDEAPKAAAAEGFNEGLKKIDAVLREQSAEGPYFLGSQFSLADVAAVPFIQRFSAVAGPVLGVRINTDGLDRYNAWVKAISARESVVKTYWGDDNVIEGYKKRFAK